MKSKESQQLVQKVQSSGMRSIYIDKITLNVGAGKDEQKLKRGVKLLHTVAGIEPVKTTTQKKIPGWGLRPGLEIGAKITIRGQQAEELLKRFFSAKGNKISLKSFDNYGNFAFGIHEYIDIPGVEYDPEIKILGFEIAVTLKRPGFRIKERVTLPRRVGKSHQILQKDAAAFIKEKFGIEIEGDEQ